MSADVIQLRICRECDKRVTMLGRGFCHQCQADVDRRIAEHRARMPRVRERCALPSCQRPFREHERIWVRVSDRTTYCLRCLPAEQQGQVQS